MAIEHAKEADLGPLDSCWNLLVLGFEDVQDDGDSVFVVFADDALVRVRRV